MPEQERKAAQANKPVSFRPSAITRRQLDALMALWNENQSQAVSRCVERVWEQEIGREGKNGNSTPTEQ